MSTDKLLHRARSHAVPLAAITVLLIAAVIFRGHLIAWFTGESPGGDASKGVSMTAGDLTVEAALEPNPPEQEDNTLILRLQKAHGEALEDAEVEVTLSMPPMGSMAEMRSKAEVSEAGDGTYRAAFDLAMGGTWNVLVTAETSAGDLEAEYKLTIGTSGLTPVGATVSGAEPAVAGHSFTDQAKGEIDRALAAYEQIRGLLAADETDGLKAPASAVADALRATKTADTGLPAALQNHIDAAATAADELARASDLAGARPGFSTLSKHVIAVASADPRLTEGMHVFECPMTDGFNKWLQPESALENPFMGPEMLTCGSEIDVASAAPGAEAHAHVEAPDDIAHYTCPMDTWVKQKEPGTCPVCSMDLVPVTEEEVRTGIMRIDHRRRQLIGLKTALVQRRDMSVEINAVGRVVYDETRLEDVTLKYEGWVQKLRVEETGQRVRRGQTLFTVYSPDLYTAQQEYLLAIRQRDTARDEHARKRAEGLIRGAKQRLRLWDVTNAQLARIARRGEPLQYLPVAAPASGYVVAKEIVQGASFRPGQRLFRIASLDKVWVEADVYEQDIPLVSVGQTAHITLPHLPGRTFEGEVSFIHPYMDGISRTARARIELPNEDLVLKPAMYANVEIRVPMGERLVVPESAVIYSGPRRVVFLEMDDEQLRPLPIEVGVKSDGYFEVLSGLEEGDHIVTSGNFLLSSESRLKAATGLW